MTDFEWDADKAAFNLHKHGVSFEQAIFAYVDPFAIDWIDSRRLQGEERSGVLGLFKNTVLFVAYTERGEVIRIISARRAKRHEQDDYYRQNAR